MSQAVVEFPVSRVSKRSIVAQNTSAEIIIFPGVRFERLEEETAIEELFNYDKTTRQMRTLFAQLLES
jgi:hypothetical protein